jgi:hypothetical protein
MQLYRWGFVKRAVQERSIVYIHEVSSLKFSTMLLEYKKSNNGTNNNLHSNNRNSKKGTILCAWICLVPIRLNLLHQNV